MKKIKRALAILLVMIVSFSVVSVGAEAVSVSLTNSDYGYMLPANYNFTKTVSTVYLNGSYDYINFYINSEYSETYFFYEIYSDKNCTKLVTGDYTYCSDYGTYKYTPYIKLLGTFSTGTYYCVTYAADIDEYENVKVSKSSMVSFKIVVNRNPSYSQNTVGLKSVTNTVDGPKVSWYKLNNSTVKYNIYRRYLTGNKWVKVGTVNGSTYTFTDKSVKNKNGRYVYTVRGVDKNGTLTKYHYSGVAAHYAAAPVVSSVSTVVDNRIQVKWNDVGSGAKYYIYRKENNGGWVLLKSNYNGTVFYDTTAKSGNNYRYTVRAFIYTGTGNAFSSFYNGKAVDYVEAPRLNQTEFTGDSVTISWNAVEGAEKYAIYRKSLETNSTWKILGRVDSDTTSYIDKTAVEDGAYRYTVRSEGATNQGSYKSEGVYYVNLAEPEIEEINVYDGSLRLQWNTVQNADSYYLMYNDGSGWKCSDRTTDNTYIFDFKQTECTEYQFSVMPTLGTHKGTYKTDVDSVVTFPRSYLNCLVYNDYIRLSWKNIKADCYNVYRKLKDSPDTDYELLANITNTAYNDYSAGNNVLYTYCVKAVYHSVEQKVHFETVNTGRYDAEKYIKDFKSKKINYYINGEEVIKYEFEIEKTPEGENLKTTVYALTVNGWINTADSRFKNGRYEFATEKPTFFVVAYDSNGRTPIDGYKDVIEEAIYARPQVRLNTVWNGISVSWSAIDGAVEYVVEDLTNGTKQTVAADGSASYTTIINSSSIKKRNDLSLRVSAVDSNGNALGVVIEELAYCWIPKLLSVKTSENGNTIYYISTRGLGHGYHIFRKAPGAKNWTCIGYTYANNYTDTTAVAGVKYTYTVRVYNPVQKYYASYYDTEGLQVGEIATPKMLSATNYYNSGINICWERNYSAEGYYLYRRTENSGWQRIAQVSNSSYNNYINYVDYGAQTGVTYYYTVIAYDGKTISGFDRIGVSCKKS